MTAPVSATAENLLDTPVDFGYVVGALQIRSCMPAGTWSPTRFLPGERPTDRYLHHLLVLNVALQLFDGVATYSGVALGWSEANPLLRTAFLTLGLGPTLILFKALACGLLLLLYRTAPPRLAIHTLRILAAVYCVFSMAPWLAKFLALLSKNF